MWAISAAAGLLLCAFFFVLFIFLINDSLNDALESATGLSAVGSRLMPENGEIQSAATGGT